MDVLSEVLENVRLTGAMFYNAEFSAPWAFRSPASHTLAPFIRSADAHVIIYHLLTDGSAWARLETGVSVQLGPGDLVMFPHGDPHLMGNGSPFHVVDGETELNRMFLRGLDVVRMGGGGDVTKVVCGYMACEPRLSEIVLCGLPPLLSVNIRSDPAGGWLEHSIRFAVSHASTGAAGAEAVLAKLSEALFAETLRRYVTSLPDEEKGWLAGARDPQVSKVLALLHRRMAHPWTIAELAHASGLSRSVLAERFRYFLNDAPIAYLVRWRLTSGARLLTTTDLSVSEVASRVGYESEAAFNRAFKRRFGEPPARFRRNARPSPQFRTAMAE